MIVVGLDLSLRDSGFVVGAHGHNSGYELLHHQSVATRLKDGDDNHATGSIVQRIVGHIVDSKYDLTQLVVVIENYAMGARVGKSFTRSEIAGALKYIFSTVLGVPVYLVAPNSLKAHVAHGQATKEEMRTACFQKYGFYDENDNIVDAYCLTRYFIANRSGERLTLIYYPPYRAFGILQVPAKIEVAQTPKLPLTKKLQPRNLKFARRILR